MLLLRDLQIPYIYRPLGVKTSDFLNVNAQCLSCVYLYVKQNAFS